MSSGAPALINAHEVALAYGHHKLLESVILTVGPGEKVGLVGRNGCGKTSLLKILAGVDQPDSGEVSRQRGLRVGYLPQDGVIASGKTLVKEVETAFKARAESFVADFDLVKRDDVDVLHDMVAAARTENEALKARLDALEARLVKLEGGKSDLSETLVAGAPEGPSVG